MGVDERCTSSIAFFPKGCMRVEPKEGLRVFLIVGEFFVSDVVFASDGLDILPVVVVVIAMTVEDYAFGHVPVRFPWARQCF